MKKILTILSLMILLTGCSMSLDNTPKKKAEAFLTKYQSLDKAITDDLNRAAAEETSFNTEQRLKYIEIMKSQYKGLVYTIKDTTEDGIKATVVTEIEVTDFYKVLSDADAYLAANPTAFEDTSGKYDASKFMDYRLTKMKEAKEKITYTLNLSVTKVDDEWQVDPLSSIDQQKINGIYAY